MDTNFEKRLEELYAEAFRTVRESLRKFPDTSCIITKEDKPYDLYIDTCDETGFLWHFTPRKVRLVNDCLLYVFAEMTPEHEDDLIHLRCDWQPDEIWTYGGKWYAEPEGLFRLYDIVNHKATML